MERYRKKPVEIEAEQWNKHGDNPNVEQYLSGPMHKDQLCKHCNNELHMHGWVPTLEGGHAVCPGDWIITGIMGEKYPCKPDIFEQTYERVHPIRHCMVCPSTDDVKRYKTKHNGSFCPNGGDGYVQYCKNHANQHGYTDEDLHSTHR